MRLRLIASLSSGGNNNSNIMNCYGPAIIRRVDISFRLTATRKHISYEKGRFQFHDCDVKLLNEEIVVSCALK